MLFNSLTFVAFFALLLALHNAPLPWKVKKTNLLLGSYLFYAQHNFPGVVFKDRAGWTYETAALESSMTKFSIVTVLGM